MARLTLPARCIHLKLDTNSHEQNSSSHLRMYQLPETALWCAVTSYQSCTEQHGSFSTAGIYLTTGANFASYSTFEGIPASWKGKNLCVAETQYKKSGCKCVERRKVS